MSSAAAIAKDIARVTAMPPVVMSVRTLQRYEVSISSVDVVEETTLPKLDRAILSLVAAQGRSSAMDVRAWLGVGEDVSLLAVRRLIDEGLLEESAPGPVSPTLATPAEPVTLPAMRTLVLSARGAESLAMAKRIAVRRVPIKLVFWEEPLWLVDVPQVARSADKTGKRLEPNEVPETLRRLDDVLALPPPERERAIGLPEHVPGVGKIAGLSPNAQFEVRKTKLGPDTLAGVAHDRTSPLIAFIGSPRREMVRCAGLDAALGKAGVTDSAIKRVLEAQGCTTVPGRPELTPAMLVTADETGLPALCGETDAPDEGWVSKGRLAVRVRALPADSPAALAAYVEFLCRRLIALNRDLDGTLTSTWRELASFWGEPDRPMPDRAAIRGALWTRHAARGALCTARLASDLVEPYAEVA